MCTQNEAVAGNMAPPRSTELTLETKQPSLQEREPPLLTYIDGVLVETNLDIIQANLTYVVPEKVSFRCTPQACNSSLVTENVIGKPT